jgi:hypothetical protein
MVTDKPSKTGYHLDDPRTHTKLHEQHFVLFRGLLYSSPIESLLKKESSHQTPLRASRSTAKWVFGIILAATALSACSLHFADTTRTANSLSQEERHRLYTAVLAASDSPLDAPLYKEVCQKIGIFDTDGNPNSAYLGFVQEHVAWSMNSEANQFRSEISTKEKAQQYVTTHLP